MSRPRFANSPWLGHALVLALFGAAEIEVWTQLDDRQWTTAAFAAAWTLPLLLRRRSALAAAVLVTGSLAVEGFVYYDATESMAGFLAFVASVFLLGLHEPRTRAIGGGIVCFAAGTALFSNDTSGFTTSDVLVMAFFTFAPLAAGVTLRERTERAAELERQAERLERARDDAARLAVAEERARIADELQRLIAHAVDTMTAQADAAAALAQGEPAAARAPIERIEAAGREALDETRRLLGVLRRDLADPAGAVP